MFLVQLAHNLLEQGHNSLHLMLHFSRGLPTRHIRRGGRAACWHDLCVVRKQR